MAYAYVAKLLVFTLAATANIEIKLSDIPKGKSVTFKWRGKPLFIPQRFAAEQVVSMGTLRDLQTDIVRIKIPERLVVGVSTHLS